MSTKKNSKNFFSTGLALLIALLLLAVVIPINLITGKVGGRIDMTPKRIYALADETVTVLENLENDVYVYPLFNMEALPEDEAMPTVMTAIYYLLKNYDGYDRVHVVPADTQSGDGLAILAALNLPDELIYAPGDTLVMCNGLIKRVYVSNTYTQNLDTAQVSINMENDITSAIAYVSKGINPVVYYLGGHGEPGIESYATLAANMTKSGYNIEELTLADVDAVPENAKVLLEVAPKTDFSESDTKKINDFLDNGGNIEFFLPPNESPEPYANIQSILQVYSLEMNYDDVTETDYSRLSATNSDAFLAEIIPYTGKKVSQNVTEYEGDYVDLTTQIIAMAREESVATYMPRSRSFFAGTAGSGIKYAQLLATSESGMGMPIGGPYNDPDPVYGALTLAAYSVDTERENSAVLAFGGDFLNNENASSSLFFNPLSIFLVSITWLHEQDIDLNIPRKIVSYDSLVFDNEKQANRTIGIFYAVPAAIAFLGAVVYLRRNKSVSD